MSDVNFAVSTQNDIGFNRGAALSKAQFMWIVSPNFSMTKLLAAVKANVLAKVATEEIVPLYIKAHEYKHPEANVTTYDSGDKTKNWENKRSSIFTVEAPLDMHAKLRSFNGADVSIVLGDMNGNLMFTSSDGLLVEPFSTSYFNVDIQEWGAGFTTKIEVVFGDNEEWDSFGGHFKPNYALAKISAIKPLTIISQTTVSATVFTIGVAWVSEHMSDDAGVLTQEAARGLDKVNIVCANTATPNTWITPASAVDTNNTGTYVVTATGFTGGICKIIPTATNLYKSASVTIVAA